LRVQVRLLLDALSGLAALHQAKLNGKPLSFVHGEFAPHNILVGRDGIARLIPLVKSHWMDPPVPAPESLGYVAPERLLGDVFDQRADIFSAGVLFWEAVAAKGLFGNLRMDAVVTQLVGSKVVHPAPPPDAPWGAALADVAMQAIAVDPADRWPHVGVMGAEIETIADGFLPSSEEVAQLMRRRAQGEAYVPPVEVLPIGRASSIPPEPPSVVEAPSSAALVIRPRPSVPESSGLVSWSGPRSSRRQTWEDEPSREAESIRVSEPAPQNLGPKPSVIGWAAVVFGVLSAIAAFMLFKRETSSGIVSEGTTVATEVVVAPQLAGTATATAAPNNDAVARPSGRPQVAAQGVRPTPKTSPASAAPAPAAPRSGTPRASSKTPEPVAPSPTVAPAESAQPPPAPKPKEDLFGI